MPKTNSLYHVYSSRPGTKVLAHSLTYQQLLEKIAQENLDLESVEILEILPDKYKEDPSY